LLNNRNRILFASTAAGPALLACLPVLSIFVLSLKSSGAIWPHLLQTVLPHYLAQTSLFMLGLSLVAVLIGVPLAWGLSNWRFAGSDTLQWLALLPMAMPGYITSFIYVDFLNYAGPLQTALRATFGWKQPSDYHFPEIRSVFGASIIMGLALYPYVFIAARAAFLKQHQSQIEVSRTLGHRPWETFFKIVLPQARPAIIIGLSLVLLEGLNDVGAANFFGLQTLTLAVYSTWLGQGSLEGAAQLALLLLLVTGLVLLIERRARGQDHALRQAQRPKPLEATQLSGMAGILALLAALLPILLGFALPALLLLRSAFHNGSGFDATALWHSLMLAAVTALLVLLAGGFLAYAERLNPSRLIQTSVRLSTLGYAVPGTIIGLGTMAALGRLDNAMSPLLSQILSTKLGLLFSGSAFALVLAYFARFLAMGHGTIETGLHKIPTRIDDVARTLGSHPMKLLRDIHVPLLRPAIMSAAILVFVDTMKELPATLILRPFAFDTLATKTYELASLDKLEAAAGPALAIVLAGLIPVALLSRNLRRED